MKPSAGAFVAAKHTSGLDMKIQVKVTPNSKTEEVKQEGDILLVRVKEPPKEGRANAAVVKAVAKHFGVPASSVKIVSGYTSRQKVLEIDR